VHAGLEWCLSYEGRFYCDYYDRDLQGFMTAAILPRRLILHVGQAKAGSTAIQNYLDSQRLALSEAGILFPSFGFARSNPFDLERTAGHLSLVRDIARNSVDCKEKECLLDARTIILSAENLFLDRPDKELVAIKEFFCSHVITMVLVARGAASWLESRYIEDVMSGFKAAEYTFGEFCLERKASGGLDYASRLRNVAGLLQTSDVRLINYEAAKKGEGLIVAFLAAAGLPVTAPRLASTLKSNRREKHAFLIEGKRRINHFSKVLPRDARLQLEAHVRSQAAVIATSLDSLCLHRWEHPPVLSLVECRQISASNRFLEREYGLATPLPDPAPTAAHPWLSQHRKDWPGTDELTVFGLQTASSLCSEVAMPLDRAAVGSHLGCATGSLLAKPGIALLIQALAGTTISLHLESPETALWAACLYGKLPILFSDFCTVSDFDRLMSLKLPSDVITLDSSISLQPMLRGRSIDLMVVAQDVSTVQIQQLWQFSGSAAKIVMIDPNIDVAETVAEDLGLTCTAFLGCVRVLAPPGTQSKKADSVWLCSR